MANEQEVKSSKRMSASTSSPPPLDVKRARVPLKFSIESIMQPYQQSASPSESVTPSPPISPQVSTRSPSPEPTCSSHNYQQHDYTHNHIISNQHHHLNSHQINKPPPVVQQQFKNHQHPHNRPKHQVKCSTNQVNGQPANDLFAGFKCHLDNLDLWHRFHPLDTEMIITKQGRRMFPPVRVTFSLDENNNNIIPTSDNQVTQQQHSMTQPAFQLNSRDKYHVLMDILPYDKKRYRYAYHKSSWQQAGKADPPSPAKLFLHPDGPFTLEQLKRQSVISFEKIKLTNNDANKHGYIVLNSMHKYQPRIHLVLWRGKESSSLANAPISALEQEIHKTFVFSETIFTAVTAYQNHSITKLKIDSNPFAKGFRDSTRLTDLELESMQDLISDGQCPFSPPRAPPPGFPHFLFSAAAMAAASGQYGPPAGHAHLGAMTQQSQQQQQPGGEDPASQLLRERTIMALDSFLQHQQHQQQQQQQQQPNPHDASSPASQVPRCGGGATPTTASTTTPTSCAPPPPTGGALEQFIMQQQLAAAMAAAAAAAHNHQHLFPAAHLPTGSPPGSKGGDARSGTPPYATTGATQLTQLTTPTPHYAMAGSGEQTSPIGAAKSAARSQMLAAEALNFFTPPQGGGGGGSSAAAAASYQAHLQAFIMHQQRQHQMASLSQQMQPPPPTATTQANSAFISVDSSSSSSSSSSTSPPDDNLGEQNDQVDVEVGAKQTNSGSSSTATTNSTRLGKREKQTSPSRVL